MKVARGHGPAARLPVPHHRFLRNAAKRKSHQRSSVNMRIANALRQSAGLSSRSAKRSLGRSRSNSKRLDNPRPQSASPPPAEETEGDPSMPSDNVPNQHGADPGNLRRSTRKRRVLVHVDYESDNSEHEVYRSQSTRVSKHRYTSHTAKAEPSPEEEGSPELAETKNTDAAAAPRREGLRPRQGIRPPRLELSSQDYEDDDQNSSDREMGMKGEEEDEEEEEEEEEDEEEEEEEEGEGEGEERDGRRRYALRNRTGVQRFSPRKEERPTARARSPRKMFHGGSSTKRGREGRRSGSRSYKRHRSTRADDSDDSLLVDEQDQGAAPWLRMGRGSSHPWLPPGLEAPGMSNLGMAASGWGQPGSHWASSTPGGAQTAGPSSKGGADIQPVQVDDTVGFDQIGGLAHYIDQLKEMVFFPLLYPDFFAKYHITPPRGVLLSGPPGTGKTLIARAMASAASRAGQKVNFYMRKGADVLSKWVGEAERQLRMLFEEAQRCQPSIIFFDEIDGLAPVRSSKQEQIHNSIVSTLLALMDGLDSRGQVVVIGATNRIDAIDGALRRPGRFDRELILNHPTFEARVEILDIHTRKWQKPPSEELRRELAASCVGYCGADLKALCTEAAIRAFRRKFPQVYRSDEQFVIDVESVDVERRHFLEAVSAITPASHRGAVTHARPFSSVIAPCLEGHLQTIMTKLSDIFPVTNRDISSSAQSDSDEDESPEQLARLFGLGSGAPLVYRPKFLLCGTEGAGLDHVGPAVLHELERFPVHSLGLPSLLSDPSAKSPEEALVHIFGEARRNTPSILYLPQLHLWWDTAHDQLRAVLKMLLGDLPSDLPVLFLGTACVSAKDLDEGILSLFGHNCYEVRLPSADVRSKFFSQLVDAAVSVPRRRAVSWNKQKEVLPELPKAPKVVKGPSEAELRERAEVEENQLRRLRMCFRDICNRLLCERRFSIFHYPVLDDEAPDYRNVVHNPMDVATLLQRVDSGHYLTKKSFLGDVDLIPANAQEYNGDDYQGGRIVSKACALRDAVLGMASTIDPALVKICDEIAVRGGPTRLAGVPSGVLVPAAAPPVVRASARLRGFQPEVDALKTFVRRTRRSSEGLLPGEGTNGNCSDEPVDRDVSEELQTEGAEMVVDRQSLPDPGACDDVRPETVDEQNGNGGLVAVERNNHSGEPSEVQQSMFREPSNEREDGRDDLLDKEAEVLKSLKPRIDAVKQKLVQCTDRFGVYQLEMLHANICRLLQHVHGDSCTSRLTSLEEFIAEESNLTC